jgi:hypothetical protein
MHGIGPIGSLYDISDLRIFVLRVRAVALSKGSGRTAVSAYWHETTFLLCLCHSTSVLDAMFT